MTEYIIRFCLKAKVDAPDGMRAADKVACWVLNLKGFDYRKNIMKQRGEVPFEIVDWGYVDSVRVEGEFLFGETILCPNCAQRIDVNGVK